MEFDRFIFQYILSIITILSSISLLVYEQTDKVNRQQVIKMRWNHYRYKYNYVQQYTIPMSVGIAFYNIQ